MKRDMRRSDRLVTDRDTIEVFLDEAKVIHLGLEDDGEIYVVPLNYGWEWKGETLMLYCHSAQDRLDWQGGKGRLFHGKWCKLLWRRNGMSLW